MAFVVGSCSVGDFDAWQHGLTTRVLAGASGVVAHTVYRGTARPEAVVLVVEVADAAAAAALRASLDASGLLGEGEATPAAIVAHARNRPPEGPFPHVH
jgi:hypothetical protein